MFLSKKEIEEEYLKLYDELINGDYNRTNVESKINESTRQPYDKVLFMILEMDRNIGTGLLKGKRRLLYWGLLQEERERIQAICIKANNDNVIDIFYEAFNEYFKIFLENNLKYDEIKDEINNSKYINDIVRLHDAMSDFYFKRDKLIWVESDLRKRRDKELPNPSVCTLIWAIVLLVDRNVRVWYSDTRYRKNSIYYPLSQEELDELFVMCSKGNNLGINLYLNNNAENGINHLTDDEIYSISEIGKEAINRYFEILNNKNVEYKKMETKFLNMMNEFGKRHDINERELVEFSNKALELGYNVLDIETQEELDKVYKMVFPEA